MKLLFWGQKTSFISWKIIIKYKVKLKKAFIGIVRDEFTYIWVSLSMKVWYKITLCCKMEGTNRNFNWVVSSKYLTSYYKSKHSEKRAWLALN